MINMKDFYTEEVLGSIEINPKIIEACKRSDEDREKYRNIEPKVICPYCGSVMGIMRDPHDHETSVFEAEWSFFCEECYSYSPIAKTADDAYRAARRRNGGKAK